MAQGQTDAFLGKLGEERPGASKLFYLITFSRVLPQTLSAAAGTLRDVADFSRKQLATAVRNAFNSPLPPKTMCAVSHNVYRIIERSCTQGPRSHAGCLQNCREDILFAKVDYRQHE